MKNQPLSHTLRRNVAITGSLLIWISMVGSCLAQAQSKVQVSVYYVPENIACRPDGYGSSSESQSRSCEKLQYETDVLEWERSTGVPRQSFSLLTGSIRSLTLTKQLNGILNSYSETIPSTDPAQRRAAVFVFDFGDFLTTSASLTRLDPKKRWGADLRMEQRWIVHQAAQFLHPFNSIIWKLEVGGESMTWSFAGRQGESHELER